jgi:hypothetical protein
MNINLIIVLFIFIDDPNNIPHFYRFPSQIQHQMLNLASPHLLHSNSASLTTAATAIALPVTQMPLIHLNGLANRPVNPLVTFDNAVSSTNELPYGTGVDNNINMFNVRGGNGGNGGGGLSTLDEMVEWTIHPQMLFQSNAQTNTAPAQTSQFNQGFPLISLTKHPLEATSTVSTVEQNSRNDHNTSPNNSSSTSVGSSSSSDSSGPDDGESPITKRARFQLNGDGETTSGNNNDHMNALVTVSAPSAVASIKTELVLENAD